MTTDATAATTAPHGTAAAIRERLRRGKSGPIAVVCAAIVAIWYVGAVYLNAPVLIDRYERQKVSWSIGRLVDDAWAMKRPVLPAPHQIAADLDKSIFKRKLTSKRNLAFHAWVTLSSTLLGFLMGTALGVALAVGIVHVRTLDRSLMPWIIASQTIPILAIAPMIIVVLGNVGFTGLVPKAIISMYLCFFPVAIGMVKGLRSPDRLQLDLMRTYSSTQLQIFVKLRWPASLPFLFASLKVAIAISLVGAIVGELPTGAQAGLGARMLVGSYYGQTIQIWSALIVAALLAGTMVGMVGVAERIALRRTGAVR
ncbi:MAG: ABC transporter permease [Alphaproteobacteria bacterium]